MQKKVLKFDCAAEKLENDERQRPEFLSVSRHFKSLLKGVIKSRAGGVSVKIYEIKTSRTFMDPVHLDAPSGAKGGTDEKDSEEPKPVITLKNKDDKPVLDAFKIIDVDENNLVTHNDLKECM